MTKRCVIITAGELGEPSRYQDVIRPGDFLICCDGGYAHAKTLGVRPDLILGDFDSYEGDLPEGVPTEGFSSIKDDTDTMLAIKEAIHRGYEEILLLAALGGRMDHSFANLQSLMYLRQAGKKGWLVGARDRAYLLFGGETLILPGKKGWRSRCSPMGNRWRGSPSRAFTIPFRAPGYQWVPLGGEQPLCGPVSVLTLAKGTLLVMVSQI